MPDWKQPDWKQIVRDRLAALKLEGARESEVFDELAQHLEDRYEELLHSGISEAEAERLAIERMPQIARQYHRTVGMVQINALFEPDTEAGGFVVTFPDLPWGVTQGDTEAEATEMAKDAIALVIEELIRRGQEIPEQAKVRGRKYRTIRLPAMQDAKVELYRQFRASGLRKVDLARRLGIPKTVVDRLFDLTHHSRLEQIEAAFAALGKRLAIQILDAA